MPRDTKRQGSGQDCRSAHAFSSSDLLAFFHRLIDSGEPASSFVVSVSTSPATSQCCGRLKASGPPPHEESRHAVSSDRA